MNVDYLFTCHQYLPNQPVKCQRAVTSARIDPAARACRLNPMQLTSLALRDESGDNQEPTSRYIHGDNQATPITNTRGRHTTRPQHTATMSIAPQRGAPPKRSSTVLVRHSHLPLPLHIPINPHSRPRFRPRLVSRGLRNSRAVHG
jgi:hypothetical protein